jgi:hypothetical protein
MPNLGASMLMIIIGLGFVIAAVIGYWCMVVFQRKGRSAGAGFALGFFLTLFFSVIGTVIAILIAYLQSPAVPSGGQPAAPAPPPPPPVGPTA